MITKKASTSEVSDNGVDPNLIWNKEFPSVLVFDVNETLIDFESMNLLFQRVFGGKRVLREWLGHLMMYSMTITMSGLYKDYFSLGEGLFRMVGSIHGIQVKQSDIDELKRGMMTMPAHSDVEEGLSKLKEKGFRLVTLTNSPPNPHGKSSLEHAGLGSYFERQFSIETVRAYKPAQQVYHFVAQELGLSPTKCCMVAAHVWDTVGAQSAGYSAALITRPGNAPLPLPGLPQPTFVASDLSSFAMMLTGSAKR
jgi:2-haloacid dehalogenase